MNPDAGEMYVRFSGEEIEKISLENIFNQILEEAENGEMDEYGNNFVLDKEKLTFNLEGRKIKAKVYFSNVSIPNPKYEEKEISKDGLEDFKRIIREGYMNGYVLLKEK